jgi:hypothetical protein
MDKRLQTSGGDLRERHARNEGEGEREAEERTTMQLLLMTFGNVPFELRFLPPETL